MAEDAVNYDLKGGMEKSSKMEKKKSQGKVHKKMNIIHKFRILCRENKFWICTLIIFLLAIMIGLLVINILFKIHPKNNIFVAEWNSGDALSFYAVIISSLLATFGISLTIKSSKEQLMEDIRNNTLPYFVIDFLDVQTKFFSIDDDYNDSDGYQPDSKITGYANVPFKEFVLIIDEHQVTANRSLTNHQKKVIKNSGIFNTSVKPGINHKETVNYIYVSFVLKNVGNGPAVNLRIGFNRVDNNEKQQYIKPTSLESGSSINGVIYSENIPQLSDKLGKYVMDIVYSDIYNNRYRQSSNFNLYFDVANYRPGIKAEIMTEQEMVN